MVGSHQLHRGCTGVGVHHKLLAGGTPRMPEARKPEEAEAGLTPWSEGDA